MKWLKYCAAYIVIVFIALAVGCVTEDKEKKDPIIGASWIKGKPGEITQKLNRVNLYRKSGVAWIHIEYDKLSWPHVVENNKKIDAWTCVFALRNGVWTGGKIEQNKVNDSERSLVNEDKKDYLPGVKFISGEKVLVCIIPKREDIKEMSNSVEGIWP